MRIAIDASRSTVTQRTGTEEYARQMIGNLLKLESPHDFHLYFRDAPEPDLFPSTAHQHVIPWPRMWTHLRFAAELWKTRPDLLWVPAHTLPRFFPSRAVVTVHDLGYRHFPQAHPEAERRYLDWSTGFSARRARRVMADSNATREDLIHFYNLPPEKIQVVYPGVDNHLQKVYDPLILAALRAKYGLPERYLLFIGTLQPRKNIGRLAQAFHQWWRASAHQDVVLALGGKAGWLYDPTWTANIPQVQLLGYVADEDIAALYSGALGLVFPSLYEGFGFPVLEAMACGCPVLCSGTSSLPELAGDAAILCDPLKTDEIAQGIQDLVEDSALRRHLIQSGHLQVQKFTWERAAQNALALLEAAGS